MKKAVLRLLAAALLVIPAAGFAGEKQEKLMTIVTSGDAMTQLMAMVLSTQALKQGADVEVLFCAKAGDLVCKDAEEVTFKPKGMSPNKLLKGLIANGANVGVCPPYLPNNGKTKADLIEGVNVVKPPKVAARIMDKDTKILSY